MRLCALIFWLKSRKKQKMNFLLISVLVLIGVFVLRIDGSTSFKTFVTDCSSLRLGQYLCPDPDLDQIDPKTQQFFGCNEQNIAKVACIAATGIKCQETQNGTFYKEMPCKWTNGYSLETTLLLSVFLGMFGADRFYLGYPAIGFAKLCTFGFFFIGQLFDIIWIATEQLRPADGSYYIIPYYGPGVEIVRSNNWTYKAPF